MSPASVHTLPIAAPNAFSLWLQKGLNAIRTAFVATPVPEMPPQPSRHQEAEKLRAMARSMMRIDAGYAADMFIAADRQEFGHLA